MFKWDLVASLPADFVLWLVGGSGLPIRTLALVRCSRFVHLLRLPYLLQSVIDFLEEHGVRAKAGVWHCTRMVFFVLLTTHWFACTLYYIAVLQGLDNKKSWTAGTVYEDESVSIEERYTTCLYWSVYTVTLVGELVVGVRVVRSRTRATHLITSFSNMATIIAPLLSQATATSSSSRTQR